VLVLLVICIGVFLFHLLRIIGPDWERKCNQAREEIFNIAWLKGADIPEGFYSVPAQICCNKLESGFPSGSSGNLLSGVMGKDGSIHYGTALSPEATPFFLLPIPINKANADLLTTIPGIGPRLAERIIDFRKSRDRIKTLDELLEINGIGKAKFEMMRGYVTVSK